MSLALYMDEHVHRAISLGLRLRGVDVLTVQEDDHRGASDSLLLDRAHQIGRIVFTQDDDFLIEATRRQREGIPFSGVIYGHQLRLTIGRCINDLDTLAKVCELEDVLGRVEFLPL